MFAQTDAYTSIDALALKINIPAVIASSTNGTGYRFMWLKSDFSYAASKADSDYSILTLDPDLPVVTAYPSSDFGVMLDAATFSTTTWQMQPSPFSTLTLTSESKSVTLDASSVSALFIPSYTPTSWSAAYNTGSGRSLMDNSWTYSSMSGSSGVYNNTLANPWCVATLNVGAKCVLYQLRYDFATDSTNYKKKIKYIDIYKWSGDAWVLAETFSTTSPVVGASSSEYFTLTVPLDLDASSKQIKIACRSNWGDTNGYYWVSEIVPYVRQR